MVRKEEGVKVSMVRAVGEPLVVAGAAHQSGQIYNKGDNLGAVLIGKVLVPLIGCDERMKDHRLGRAETITASNRISMVTSISFRGR